MGAYVDLPEQRIRLWIELDDVEIVKELATADWLEGKVLDLREFAVHERVHFGRVATIRVLDDTAEIADPRFAPDSFKVDTSWRHTKFDHWNEAVPD